jgi:hypothetical protein
MRCERRVDEEDEVREIAVGEDAKEETGGEARCRTGTSRSTRDTTHAQLQHTHKPTPTPTPTQVGPRGHAPRR